MRVRSGSISRHKNLRNFKLAFECEEFTGIFVSNNSEIT